MRAEDAVYGGEMSAHHYFRDFAYCDSGMIPWLLVIELLSLKRQPLSAMVDERIKAYPSPGEINFRLKSPGKALAEIKSCYANDALAIDETDGVSIEFTNWRFNLRTSNTEPIVRLNLETRKDRLLIKDKLAELVAIINKNK
jgi:phosphomannomutase